MIRQTYLHFILLSFTFFFTIRRIVVHDCSVTVFQLFLRFIYTGQISTDVTLDILSDLIALADR